VPRPGTRSVYAALTPLGRRRRLCTASPLPFVRLRTASTVLCASSVVSKVYSGVSEWLLCQSADTVFYQAVDATDIHSCTVLRRCTKNVCSRVRMHAVVLQY
jgi:hypothetical protein